MPQCLPKNRFDYIGLVIKPVKKEDIYRENKQDPKESLDELLNWVWGDHVNSMPEVLEHAQASDENLTSQVNRRTGFISKFIHSCLSNLDLQEFSCRTLSLLKNRKSILGFSTREAEEVVLFGKNFDHSSSLADGELIARRLKAVVWHRRGDFSSSIGYKGIVGVATELA